jgi:hypothetical protein
MLESAAKNDFCADMSDVVPMYFTDFSRLEDATDLSSMNLKQNRNAMKIIEDVTPSHNP